ncbi:pseudouridine synthase [Alkalibacterium iburiense]|uniref:Pseudouridine synthase n=1 Tax=Alkalibacterium iburiense TaxID=290589 RepID=A0ABN0X444_9LACT
MRLDKLLAHSGLGTRKEVKKLLKTKIVEVNEEVVTDPKVHVDPELDTITVGGEPIEYQEFVYFMLNKPQGVISATEDVMHETVLDLLELQDSLQDPHPVGRLDIDTEGLLVLTNDGKLTHQLLSPKKEVPKTYEAEIAGIMTSEDIEAFLKGVTLDDGYETLPAQLVLKEVNEDEQSSKVEITIHEGKFHQVKRMVEAVGKEVTYLKRLSMGPLTLDPNLELGSYRELTKEEIALLKQA